jgi:hypothetical protein
MTVQSPIPEGQGSGGGFVSGLFDFEFKNFIALKFIKVIYILGVVVAGIFALTFVVAGFSQGGAGAILGVLGGVVGFFLYVILMRVYLEVIALLFRIGEDSSAIKKALTRSDGR